MKKKMHQHSPIRLLLLIITVLAVGTVQAQGLEQQVEALEQEVAQLRAQLEVFTANTTASSLLAVTHYPDAAGFHTMDETLSTGELNPRYFNTVQSTILATKAVAWPSELQEEVGGFIEAATELEAALGSENVEAAAAAAAETHEQQHTLFQAVFAYLASGEGTPEVSNEAAQVPADATKFALEIGENGGAVGGASTYKLRRGDVIALSIRSATPGSLHLHGYDRDWELRAEEEVVASFPAGATGRFPLEFHPTDGSPGVVVGYLEVHP